MIYFKHSEFDSPDVPGSGIKMHPTLLRLLEQAREQAGTPFKINSGYRSEDHNAKVGGSPTSSHLKGLAVDISCLTTTQRTKILPALMKVGFTRIGISNSFLHLDVDGTKPDAIWLY